MRANQTLWISLVVAAFVIGMSGKGWAKGQARTSLSQVGQELEADYAEQLNALREQIIEALPSLSEEKVAAYRNALDEVKAASAGIKVIEKRVKTIDKARGLVNHAKRHWIPKADRNIANAKESLEKASTDEERKAAEEALTKWEADREAGLEALEQRQKAYDELKDEEIKLKEDLQKLEEAHADAQMKTSEAVESLDLESFLSSERLDSQLVRFVVLSEATPKGLAAFAQKGSAERALVDTLLADGDLMKQMLLADGAKSGLYGQAMQIYADIQKASPRANKGPLQRLALAISLEHAEPVPQRNPEARPNAPSYVNPVNRYLHYENAFLAGELDPALKDLSVWDYRHVVNGNEPDETLAWGREMLRNYRPDHIASDDYRWRYVGIVRTDIKYGSQDNKYDEPELQFFQNILKNGGICGRRAFFGRFILRAFGIPTVPRPQPGHAALAHWTPEGWVVCLGGGWGAGWASGRYNSDLNFLAMTQARATGEAFVQVKRAGWIGDVRGEKRTLGLVNGDPDFWNAVALYRQRAIILQNNIKKLDAVGEELGESDESDVSYAIGVANITREDVEIHVNTDGVITIPAVACSEPEQSSGKIIFMNSVMGGKQLHYSRNGKAQDFEYTFNAPRAGKYQLTAQVVTPSWQQLFRVSANGAEPIEMELPFTVGLWDTTEPVDIELKRGENVLVFSHDATGAPKGVTVKEFTLTPLRR